MSDIPKTHVLIGAPTYDGSRINSLTVARVLRHPPEGVLVNMIEFGGSVLTYSFNSLWCNALNLRTFEAPVTHFLLLHADIVPESDDWLAVMLAEQKRVGADVLSAVVAIKNDKGMTSTAFDTDPWNPLRLSTTQLALMKEPTWTEPNLLVNTGLMLVDFTKPWIEKITFHMHDANIKGEDGVWRANFAPEDWDFSRQCRALGVPVWATKAVLVNHQGKAGYSTKNSWGYPTDEEYRAARDRGEA